jgi:hypothetical protein
LFCTRNSIPTTGALIAALYGGVAEADIETEVTYEDGRKGRVSARLKIRDLRSYREVGTPLLKQSAVAEPVA